MSYKPSKHPKKWKDTASSRRKNELGIEIERKDVVATLSKSGTLVTTVQANIKTLQADIAKWQANLTKDSAWLKSAEPALKDLQTMPASIQKLGRELKKNNDALGNAVKNVEAIEAQIESEGDEKKKKKLIAQHKKLDGLADALDGNRNMFIITLKALVERKKQLFEILK